MIILLVFSLSRIILGIMLGLYRNDVLAKMQVIPGVEEELIKRTGVHDDKQGAPASEKKTAYV